MGETEKFIPRLYTDVFGEKISIKSLEKHQELAFTNKLERVEYNSLKNFPFPIEGPTEKFERMMVPEPLVIYDKDDLIDVDRAADE